MLATWQNMCPRIIKRKRLLRRITVICASRLPRIPPSPRSYLFVSVSLTTVLQCPPPINRDLRVLRRCVQRCQRSSCNQVEYRFPYERWNDSIAATVGSQSRLCNTSAFKLNLTNPLQCGIAFHIDGAGVFFAKGNSHVTAWLLQCLPFDNTTLFIKKI